MAYESMLFEKEGNIATLTFNRPDARNAVNNEVRAEFAAAIEEIEADWLIFPWHPDMREMVNKSFGSPVDIESYCLEGTCPECHRPFSFAEPNPGQPAWFLVKL